MIDYISFINFIDKMTRGECSTSFKVEEVLINFSLNRVSLLLHRFYFCLNQIMYKSIITQFHFISEIRQQTFRIYLGKQMSSKVDESILIISTNKNQPLLKCEP